MVRNLSETLAKSESTKVTVAANPAIETEAPPVPVIVPAPEVAVEKAEKPAKAKKPATAPKAKAAPAAKPAPKAPAKVEPSTNGHATKDPATMEIRWTEKKVTLLSTLMALSAISKNAAVLPEEIEKKSKGKALSSLSPKYDLTVQGYIGWSDNGGSGTVHDDSRSRIYLTAKGAKKLASLTAKK